MLIYFLIYIPFILSSYFDFVDTPQNKKKRIIWFWIIVFTLFRGLRWDTGTDWDQFYEVYRYSHWDNIFDYVRGSNVYGTKLMEWGYMFINALFHETGLSYTAFLLATNFLVMYCYADFSLKNTHYPLLTLILLMNTGVPFPVRQTISVAIALWSYTYLMRKNYKVFIPAAIVAFSIHRGSIIVLTLAFLPYLSNIIERVKWQYYAMAYILTFFISFTFGDLLLRLVNLVGILGDSTEVYLTNYAYSDSTVSDFDNSLLSGLSYTLFFVILLYFKSKYTDFCNRSIFKFNLFFFLYAFCACVDNLIRNSGNSGATELITRILGTLDMHPIILPILFIILAKKYINKEIAGICFVVYMGYKFWLQIVASYYHQLYIPYHSIFG